MSADATDRDAALADALADVVRWRRCEEGLLPHRREPFLRERVWLPRGRWLEEGEPGRGTVHRVGLDALDRARVVGPDRDPAGWSGADVATVTWDGARSGVLLPDRAIDYDADDRGRVVAARMTAHDGETIAERYRRDDQGRVVSIEEGAGYTQHLNGVLMERGPHFAVEHDERGPLRVRHMGSGEIRWERVDRPFAELLADGARTLARSVVEGVVRRADELDARGTEVYALVLLHFDQGNLRIDPASFALETERRSWLDGGHDPAMVEQSLLDTVADEDSLACVEVDHDEELCWRLLREAALHDPDPYTTVLDEVARVLARHDWDGLVTTSEDFVVYCANHDEDIPPKVRAIRAANPPERLAAWEAAFPGRGARADAYRDSLTPEPDFVYR